MYVPLLPSLRRRLIGQFRAVAVEVVLERLEKSIVIRDLLQPRAAGIVAVGCDLPIGVGDGRHECVSRIED